MMHSIAAFFGGILALISGVFGGSTTAPTQPSVDQSAPAIVALSTTTHDTATTSGTTESAPPTTGSTGSPQATIVYKYIPVPASPQRLAANQSGVSESLLDQKLQALDSSLRSLIFTNSSNVPSPIAQGGVWNTIAGTNKIDQLSGTRLSNITVSGVSGLTASDIPTNITAANYLPLLGGTMTGTLNVPNINASSTTATSSFAGPVTIGNLPMTPWTTNSVNVGGEFRMVDNGAAVSLFGCNHSDPTLRCYASDSTGDTSNRFYIDGNGKMVWGPGTTTADTNLARTSANSLETNAAFTLANTLTINGSSPYILIPGASGALSIKGDNGTQLSLSRTTGTAYTNIGVTSGGVSQVAALRTDSPFTSDLAINPGGGNVGIGTLSPLTKLHIYGTGAATALGQLDTNLRLQTDTGTANAGSEISFYGKGSGSAAANVLTYAAISAPVSNNSATNGAAGYLVFSTKALNTTVGLTERMRITEGGNIGMGTTTPWAKLSIAALSTNTAPLFTISTSTASATSTAFIVNSSGLVGIGTSAPTHGLSVWTPGSNGYFAISRLASGDVLNVTGNGSIGVGTTSPYAKFSISANSGDTNTTLFAVSSSTPSATSTLFSIANNGSVGIGTTTPFAKLSLVASGASSGTVFQIVNSSNLATLSMLDNGTMAYQSSVTSASGGNTFIQNLPAAQPSGTVTGTYTGFRTSMGYNSASDTSGSVTGIQGVGRLYVGAANQTQGIYGIAEYDGTGTNSGSLYGGRFQSQITSTGNVTHVIGIKIEGPVIATGATATNAYGLYVQGMTTGNAGTIGGSAAIEIEGAGSGNAIAFSGNGGSGIYSKIYSSNVNELNIEASSNLLLNTLGGKVGIGTSSPLAVLDIAGANNVSNPLFQLSSVSSFSTTTQFIVTNAGNVSIGTTSASDDLNVGDLGSLGLINANPEIKLRSGNAATTFGIDFPELSTQAGAIRLFRNTNTAGSLSFSILKGDGTSATQTFLAGGVGNSYLNALGGKVGIGTTSPFALLSLSNSATTAANTPLFVIASTTGGVSTTTVFTIASTGNVTITGSAATCTLGNGASATSCSSSDQRLKDDINTIDASTSLAAVEALRPVSFKWNQWMVGNGAATSTQFGFIAQEIQNTFPNLVTLDSGSHYYKLDYQGLFAPLVGAIQALAHTVSDFADSFTTKELTFTRATGDEVDVNTVKTKQLCIDDVCVSKSQLQAMLAAAATSGSSSTSSSGSISSTTTPDTTAPVITMNGDNPAHVTVGSAYADLGASVTDNIDTNLGIHTFLNGTLMDQLQLDTSTTTTDTIDYVATDNAGNTATSTRTVVIEAM